MYQSPEELFGPKRKQPLENLLDFIEYIEKTDGRSETSGEPKSEENESSVPDIILVGEIPYTKVCNVPFDNDNNAINNNDHNDIDTKILELIEDDSIKSEMHGKIKIDAPIFTCKSNKCPDLLPDFKSYLDEIEKNIRRFEANNRKSVKKTAIAFYKPFHTSRSDGGIYFVIEELVGWVREIHRVANLNRKYGNPSLRDIYYIVKESTFYHEMYHHKIEAFATKLEILFRQRFYATGFECFYCNTSNSDQWLEEAFANVYGYYKSLERIGDKITLNRSSIKSIIRELMFLQEPAGYSLAYELTARNRVDADYFENRFLEILWRYAYWFNNRIVIDELPDESFWNLFTYAHDPIINTINNVTYVVDARSPQGRRVNDFMLS